MRIKDQGRETDGSVSACGGVREDVARATRPAGV